MQRVAHPTDSPEESGTSEAEGRKARFFALNNTRMQRAFTDLNPRQRDFLRIIPLLFHLNNPRLPGHRERDAVYGVAGYDIGDEAEQALGRLFGRVPLRASGQRADIQGLYVCSELGTLERSPSRRLDLWLCTRPGLSDEQSTGLGQKAQAIAQFAERLNLEVRVQRPAISASGPDERGLLRAELAYEEDRDTFYTTGVWQGGRLPVWWLLPEGVEAEQCESVGLDPHEMLDFGTPARPTAKDLFWNSVEVLRRALERPLQEFPRLVVSEARMVAFPRVRHSCQRVKSLVFDKRLEVSFADRTYQLYIFGAEYLERRKEGERLELLRQAMYFLSEVKLSENAGNADWRRRSMDSLMQAWGWGSRRLESLDRRGQWKLDEVLPMSRALFAELRRTHKLLTTFRRRHLGEDGASARMLTLLGRQLRSRTTEEPGKILFVNPGIANHPVEADLTLARLAEDERGPAWVLMRGRPDSGSLRDLRRLLTKTGGPLEATVWAVVNGVLDARTRLFLQPEQPHFDTGQLRALADQVREGMDAELPLRDEDESWARAPVPRWAWLFVNIGVDPLERFSRRGQQLTSNRADALSFGGQRENLALCFDALLGNSWGELRVVHQQGLTAVLDVVCEMLADLPNPDGRDELPKLLVFGESLGRGLMVQQRIEELLADLQAAFLETPAELATQYILELGQSLYLLADQDGVLGWREIGGFPELLDELAAPRREYRRVVFDRHALPNSPLPLIYRAERPDVVQVFYRLQGSWAETYVLDEMGSLFFQRVEFHREGALLAQFDRFLASVADRNALYGHKREEPSFDCIESDGRGGYLLEARVPPMPGSVRDMLEVEATLRGSGPGANLFRLHCGDTYFEYDGDPGQVYRQAARCLLERRRSGERYPLYLTRVDFVDTNPGASQTLHFLQSKKRIERELNLALREL